MRQQSMRDYSWLIITTLLVLFLSACRPIQPPPESSMSHTDHSTVAEDTDVPFDAKFIDDMISHHQGAIDMAKMALEQAEHEEILTLAQGIIVAQTSEIEHMQSWRNEWYPALASTEGTGMGMGDMQLSQDEGVPFDQRFIEAMISHHQGAIDMAKMAVEQAEHDEIRTLAKAVITAQTAEIEQMQHWLTEWYGDSP